MPGQAAIIGLGTIDFPAAFMAADPAKLAEIGVSKVITLTSTYDHRIIQGAESGSYLDRIQRLLLGEDSFYDDVFESLGVPYEPARWNRDNNAVSSDRNVAEKAAAIQEIINAYRSRGHLIADLDPLDAKAPTMPAELDPITFDMSIWDLDRLFYTGKIGSADEHTLGSLLGILRDAYCRTVGVEYMHIMDPVQKRWIQSRVEGVNTTLDVATQKQILSRLNAAEAFEKFLHKRFTGQKRFGLEGAESAMVILDAILDSAAATDIREVVIGMPHRGRLNTLVNVVGKDVATLFREFEDMPTGSVQGSGDVKYHLGATGTYTGLSGRAVGVTLSPNPSHLETVNPVVEGMVRAKLDAIGRSGDTSVMPLLMHGDSAFAGQGVVPETLQLSQLAGYKTGGTIHVVINNQVGFTTNPDSARTSTYCTDVAKTIQAPIFHVNGDDPEACFRVGRLAFEYRHTFKRDVVIDMVCYRKHGHNEGDEPRYTQPLMYDVIDNRPSVRELYTRDLAGRKDITQEEADAAIAEFEAMMQVALDFTRAQKQEGVEYEAIPRGEGLPASFVPVMLMVNSIYHHRELNISLLSFLVIACGGLACVLSGSLSQRLGAKRLATLALFLSGLCCLLSPIFLFSPSPTVLIAFLIFWGLVVIADSPLFSTLVAQNAPEQSRGTSLTIVNCIGFSITIISIQLIKFLSETINAQYLYILLAIGPVIGLIALVKKREHTN